MKDPLGVSPSKGYQGSTRGKEKKMIKNSFGILRTQTYFLRHPERRVCSQAILLATASERKSNVLKTLRRDSLASLTIVSKVS